ncbi:MAG: hypothetical protein UHX00_14385 [Caryophanon sp.]|nr:hypothetical protein [Caryophanon sp.]
MKKWAFIACTCLLVGCDADVESVDTRAVEETVVKAATADEAFKQFEAAQDTFLATNVYGTYNVSDAETLYVFGDDTQYFVATVVNDNGWYVKETFSVDVDGDSSNGSDALLAGLSDDEADKRADRIIIPMPNEQFIWIALQKEQEGVSIMTETNYITTIQQHLQQYSEPLIETLRNVQTYNFDEAVELVDFQAFADPTLFTLAITMFSMDKHAGEVFQHDATSDAFAGSEEVLSEVAYYSLLDEQQDAFYELYEEEGFEEQEQRVIAKWFAKCWDEAGGAQFNLPAYFTFHDAAQSYDLQQGEFVDSEALWE